MEKKQIAIASDHAGFELKEQLGQWLLERAYVVVDLGTDSAAASVDYPDYGFAMARWISEEEARMGVLICGSGIGISIAANRHPKIRAALCHDSVSATLARQHNDANVLCVGARLITPDVAKECLHAFLTTAFEGGRHVERVNKLAQPTC